MTPTYSTIDILNAIDTLIEIRIKQHMGGDSLNSEEEAEIQRRIIVDGLRQHSASKGVYSEG